MDNVVMFPVKDRETIPQSLDEVVAKVNGNKLAYADIIANQMGMMIIDRLVDEGIDLEADMACDIMLILDSITSLYYKAIGAEHNLQTLSDNTYEIEDKEAFVDSFFAQYYEE